MIHLLLISLVKDVFSSFEKEKAFFSKLGIFSQEEALKDLPALLEFLRRGVVTKHAHFTNALAKYFLEDFTLRFDQLDQAFYALHYEEQQKKLETLFPESTTFFSELKRQLLFSSPQEITEKIASFLRQLSPTPLIVIQSPVFLDAAFKKQIRAEMQKTHPRSFVSFQVNAQLMGGLRVFLDGQVIDNSWFSRVQKIRQLPTLVSFSNLTI